jgi:hypothetical protein
MVNYQEAGEEFKMTFFFLLNLNLSLNLGLNLPILEKA